MIARARVDDVETSWEAARSVTRLRPKQDAVLEILRTIGASTDQQIAEQYNVRRNHTLWPELWPLQSESGLRTRRSELVDLGYVEWTGEFGLTAGGRRSRLWRAV